MGETTAYDLARDIAKELAIEVGEIGVEWIDGDPYATLDGVNVTLLIERMITAALKNGGIRP